MKALTLLTLLASTAGAANVSAASDLELLRGHLDASVTAYRGGSLQGAREHAGHALSEVWAHLRPQVASGQQAAFETALQGVVKGPGTLAPGGYEDAVNRFLAGPWATAWTDASGGADRALSASVLGTLLTGARNDYTAGMKGGRLSDVGEVQDAAAFLGRALPHAARVGPQAVQDVTALQLLLLNGATPQAFSGKVDQVRAGLQAQQGTGTAARRTEQLRVLELSLQAIRDEYVGEGEVDEALGSLADADQQWKLLQPAVSAKDAALARTFGEALGKITVALNADDKAAFTAAHTQASDLFKRVRAAVQ